MMGVATRVEAGRLDYILERVNAKWRSGHEATEFKPIEMIDGRDHLWLFLNEDGELSFDRNRLGAQPVTNAMFIELSGGKNPNPLRDLSKPEAAVLLKAFESFDVIPLMMADAMPGLSSEEALDLQLKGDLPKDDEVSHVKAVKQAYFNVGEKIWEYLELNGWTKEDEDGDLIFQPFDLEE